MDKIRIKSFVSEIERRIDNSTFGESNKKCIVVRLNDGLTQKNSIQESTFKLRAHGFKASIANAKASSFVILTNTKGIALIGSIVDVEVHDTEEGRINIYFRDPLHFDPLELEPYVKWNNSNPVRTFAL